MPIVWACQERVATYDPTEEELSVIKGVLPSIRLKGTPRLLEANLGMHSERPPQLIDLRSVFTSLGNNWEVNRTKTGWEISQPSRSGRTRISGTFSDDDEPVFLTMRVVMTDASQACLLSVESLRINQPPCSRVSSFPENFENLPHSEAGIDSPDDLAIATRRTSRAIIVNVGLHEQSVRENAALRLLSGDDVDWDAARTRHARILPRLEPLMQQHLGESRDPAPAQ